jgi:GPH family glycoside/pentoside/hexuronide:cation symporter
MPFYTAYVIRPDDVPLWLGIYLFTYFFSGFLFLPAWVWAARRFGKRGTWLASFAMGITGGPALFFLGEGDAVLLTILLVWTGSAFGAALFLGPAIQADVIDYDELHTGKRREAQYAAFWSILPKFVVIPSASIPIAILGSLGYVPGAPSQNPAVVLAIRSIFALVPASFSVFAFFIARRLPITEPTHRAIRAGIDAHRRGETVLDPLSGEVLPPPRERGVPEEAAWFLDHFSHRELVRLLGGSAARLVAGVALWAGGFLVLCVTAAWFVHRSLAGTESSPGIAPVVGVLVAGLTFSASLFHLLRLRPALWVARRGVPEVQLRAHIGQL